MKSKCRWIAAGIVLLATVSCGGGGGSPSSPSGSSSSALATPTQFRITRQQVFFEANQVDLTWTGNGDRYRLVAGTATGQSDALDVEVTGTAYTWNAPRVEDVYFIRVIAIRGSQTSAPSVEFPVYTIDLRHVIDAMFFHSGPMADNPANALGNRRAGVWPDGTNVRVLMSNVLGDVGRSNAQQFADEYANEIGGAFGASIEMSSESFVGVDFPAGVPEFTILAREQNPFCGAGAIACAFYGPVPLGPNRSIITIASLASNGLRAMEHEMGHAYGMGHVHATAAVRPEVNFMMNPQYISQHMTDPEKNAIRTAREMGLRAGWTRNQALAAGLVLPYVPGAMAVQPGGISASIGPRGRSLCTVFDGADEARLPPIR